MSRGTNESTVLLSDYNPGVTMPTDPDEYTLVGNSVFFVGTDASNGRELWKVDINTFAVSLVANIRPGNYSSSPHNLSACNGKLVFACNADPTRYGDELYVSDGTQAGTVLLKDIDPGSADSSIGAGTTIGGYTYFAANKGASGGSVPWRTDGTAAGTIMLVNASSTAYAYAGTYTSFKGSVYFFMKDSSSGNAYALWKTDGTLTSTSVVKSPVTGANSDGGVTRPDVAVVANNLLFFRGGSSATGYELWKSDGTSVGTTLVKDVRNGSVGALNSSSGSSSELVAYGSKCVFVADDGIQGKQLWKSDGTATGTTMIHAVNFTGSTPPNPNSLIVFNNTVFFRMFLSAYGEELWTTNGSTIPAEPALEIYPGSKSGVGGPTFVRDGEQVVIGNSLFFVGTDGINGQGLWRISPPLTITTQPLSKLVAKGTSATFSVAASSVTPINYRWQKNSMDIGGATSASYTIPSAALADAASYQAIAESDDGAATSTSARLGVVDTTVPPKSGNAGSTVTLAVSANVPSGTTFQWKRGTTVLANGATSSGGTISGATAATLTITKLSTNEVGSYTCTVTYNAQTVTTQPATVSIAVLPVVMTHPQPRIVNAGTSVTFTAAATVSASVTYQWKWKGAPIAGATSASYTLPAVALSNAGEYRCVLTNPSGSINTNVAKLVVIEVARYTVNALAGDTIGMGHNVAAPSTATLTYLWRKDTVALPNGPLPDAAVVTGATTNYLLIQNIGLSEAGTYTLTVGMDALSLENTVGTIAVKSRPIIVVNPVPVAVVSGPYTWQLASIGGATSYSVKGLPAGLTYNPLTGLITGTPTVTGFFTIKVTATNEVGTSPAQNFLLQIPALTDTVVGNFSATIARNRAVNGNLGGMLTLSVLPNGTLTGTLANGGKPKAIKGRVVASTGGTATYALTLVRPGLLDLKLAVTLDPAAQTIAGTLSDGTDSATISGQRHPWTKVNPTYDFEGTYNTTLDTSSTYSGIAYPQGRGWLQLIVSSTGVVTGSGRTIDNAAFTVSSTLWRNAKFALYNLLYNGRGCLVGQPAITLNGANVLDDRVGGTIEHYKMAATTVPDRHYGAGFLVPTVVLAGSRWIPPSTGQMPMNWPVKYANARMVLTQAGVASAAQASAFPQYFTIAVKGTCLFDKSVNICAATCTVNPKTGMATGSCKFTDPVFVGASTNYVRSTTYTALMIPHLNNCIGCFTLPQLPASGQTLLNSPMLTGRADVQPQ